MTSLSKVKLKSESYCKRLWPAEVLVMLWKKINYVVALQTVCMGGREINYVYLRWFFNSSNKGSAVF